MDLAPLILLWFVLVAFLVANCSQATLPSTKALGLVRDNVIAGATKYTGPVVQVQRTVGTKRALLLGLNYNGTPYRLQGCIQDVTNLETFLVSRGFQVEKLTDITRVQPTLSNITERVQSFLKSLRPSDTGFLWYSGHGTLVNGRNVWVPLDFKRRGYLMESTVRSWIVNLGSTKLFVGSDSCYSGSFMDLKYDLEPSASLKNIELRNQNRASRARKTLPVLRTADIARQLPVTMPEVARAGPSNRYDLYDVRASLSTVRPTVAFVSGCRDNQVSYDATIYGSTQGAMTWSFLASVRSPGTKSIGQLQDLMRTSLEQLSFPQVPQVSVGSAVDPNTSIAVFGL